MDSEEKASIQEAFKCIYIRKGDYFAENGRISDKIAFVEDGVFRSVYYNKKAMISQITLFMKVVLLATCIVFKGSYRPVII